MQHVKEGARERLEPLRSNEHHVLTFLWHHHYTAFHSTCLTWKQMLFNINVQGADSEMKICVQIVLLGSKAMERKTRKQNWAEVKQRSSLKRNHSQPRSSEDRVAFSCSEVGWENWAFLSLYLALHASLGEVALFPQGYPDGGGQPVEQFPSFLKRNLSEASGVSTKVAYQNK